MQIPIMEFDFNPTWPTPPAPTGTTNPPTYIQGVRTAVSHLSHVIVILGLWDLCHKFLYR